MKINHFDERIHVLDSETDSLSVLRSIAESGLQDDPFYVLDISDILRKHAEFKQALPRVHPYYAVKCNDSLMVLEILAALGTGFDCTTKAEINKVLALGVESNRIIFGNPAKPSSQITHAAHAGVDLMTFDNESELYKIKKLFPTAKLVMRIRCEEESDTDQFAMQFGCDVETEAPHLLRLAYNLGLNVEGVSFHVGATSACCNPTAFRRAIQDARQVFDLAKTLGYNFTLLDIGGGFPGERGTLFSKITEIINDALMDYFPENSETSVDVIAEPGRYYVSSAYTLACNIHSKREVKSEKGTATKMMYYINDGTYGSFNSILYDQNIALPKLLNERTGRLYESSIWGPTCDSMDKLIDGYLPNMELGDWIYFENMGAYTLPIASPFNGVPAPRVHVVADESVWMTLKDVLPLTEDHFVFGSAPQNLRLGMDIVNWKNIEPIEIELPMCRGQQQPMDHYHHEFIEI